ncbi:hypothetical protein [Aureimonas sp. N4]|uniref:hypothetical protein n=1 Tax=Aureimonas sp. N4 TaxID=1638165 RepID=UPI00078208CE|nr:hypothetical protein [Aureimonas sp. N4]
MTQPEIRQTYCEPSVSPTPATMVGLASGLTEARAMLAAQMWEIDFLRDETHAIRQRLNRAYVLALAAGAVTGAVSAGLLSLCLGGVAS